MVCCCISSRFTLRLLCGWEGVCGVVCGDRREVLSTWTFSVLKFSSLPSALKALTDFLVVSSGNLEARPEISCDNNGVAFIIPQHWVEFVSCSCWVSFPNLCKCKMLLALLYWYFSVLGSVFSKVLPYCFSLLFREAVWWLLTDRCWLIIT